MKTLERSVICLAAGFGALVLATIGCHDPPAQCDPGQEYKGGVCMAIPPDAAAGTGGQSGQGGSAGAAAGAGGSPGAGMCPDRFTGFGDRCAKDADCKCGADFCNTFVPAPYCSKAVDCVKDSTVCPMGWGCFDRSAFPGGLKPVCSKP